MNVYSFDVNLVGTAYIKANDPEDALKIAETLVDTGLEFSDRHQYLGDDICMDGGSFRGLYDNDEAIAFSPAMSINGEDNHFSSDSLQLVEEDIDVEEDEDA